MKFLGKQKSFQNFKQMYLFSKEELENSIKKLKSRKFLAENL